MPLVMLVGNYHQILKLKKLNEHHMFSFSNEDQLVCINIFFGLKLFYFIKIVGNNVKELIKDMRRVMEPFTAPNLKVSDVLY